VNDAYHQPDWWPTSWQTRPALQQPKYSDPQALIRAVDELSLLPPLVTSWEVNELKRQIADAASGRRFLLQGGDCAERIEDCTPSAITSKLKILLQMSLVLIHGAKKPVTRVGRFAGQYAKPRTDDQETRHGVTLPSYRGDLINRPGFTPAEREPDPQLLLRGYERAALTLNFLRALARGGFADLHHPEYWDLSFAQNSPMAGAYHRIADTIGEALHFMENVLGVHREELQWVDFFTCHEALHLLYEQAQTHQAPHNKGWFNLSTHFPWIGMRTAQPDGAHVEYFRGIRNPIGIKVGPKADFETLKRVIEILHPVDEAGRLTLIHRLGHGQIAGVLPKLIEAVRATGRTVLWVCDPMHGNTQVTGKGYKTRRFEDILSELEKAFDIHSANRSRLGGVHFEMTGEDVTECVGGARGLTEDDLSRGYRSEVDPRLNYEQALEMAMSMATKMRQ
jgi:3-deoxy-7-phosphoheptulonate synthase